MRLRTGSNTMGASRLSPGPAPLIADQAPQVTASTRATWMRMLVMRVAAKANERTCGEVSMAHLDEGDCREPTTAKNDRRAAGRRKILFGCSQISVMTWAQARCEALDGTHRCPDC